MTTERSDGAASAGFQKPPLPAAGTARRLRFYRPCSNDVYFNLALEQYLFDGPAETYDIFMLWQNENAVVIGKNQDAEAEINRAFTDKNGVNVARRMSGGGAVYHDMGNLNFSFIVKAAGDAGMRRFCQPIIDTLAQFGVAAELEGRNDIAIDGRKFSGNAQYVSNGKILHHGTILFDSNLDNAHAALNPGELKFADKRVKSVRARITNVREHLNYHASIAEFEAALTVHVMGSACTPVRLSEDDIAAVEALMKQKYAARDWIFN